MKNLQTQTSEAVQRIVIEDTRACETRSTTHNDKADFRQEFLEGYSAQLKKVVRAELRQKGCIDPEGHCDEVLGEVWLKVFRHWDSLKSPESALESIARFSSRSHARSCRREPPQEIGERDLPLFTPVVLDPTDIYEAAIYVEELLSQLDGIDRRIFSLRFQELSFDQIAEQIGMPTETIRSRYYRAVKRFKRATSSSASSANSIIIS